MSNRIKLCGLWSGTTNDGKWYLSGTLGGVKILIFANDYKQEDNQPDYQLYVGEREVQRPTESRGMYDKPQGDSPERGGGFYEEPEDTTPAPRRRQAPPQGQRPAARPGNARGQAPPGSNRPTRNSAAQQRSSDVDDFGDPFAE